MTDNEIMEALKCCGDPYSNCVECPIKADRRCNEYLANYALDLINRQQAEIEKLKEEIQITKDAYTMLQTKNEIIKSEAIKEFAESLKNKIKTDLTELYQYGSFIPSDALEKFRESIQFACKVLQKGEKR